MTTIGCLIFAVICIGVSGVPGLLIPRRAALGQWIAAALNVIGSGAGLVGIGLHYAGTAGGEAISLAWAIPAGRFAMAVDDLSPLFLFPMFFVTALAAIYGLGYWKQSRHPGNGRKLRLCWGLMTAGMASVVLARDAITLLIAWEFMALAAYFLVGTEERKAEVRRAAWIYLVATHVGTLSLFAFFALLRYATGSFALWPTVPAAAATPGVVAGLFVLGAVGFGLKAGLLPLHVWLPGAHANAPSHVSAILSGVLLKTGVYGLVRVTALLQVPPAWWGAALLAAGTLSAVFGIASAAGQRDLKRLLAYSSIENVGIVVMGLGLAALGRALGHGDWVRLGLAGALLHVLNHSLFKPLLFMGAGGVVHAARTREMDLLGGMGKAMPHTLALFVVGAIAICGLPPLNGFVSELLIYLGLFRTVQASGCAALAAPALALVGALAVASFVKVIATVFLGSPRTPRADRAHEPGWTMLAPMTVLAICCVAIGVMPGALAQPLDRAVTAWTGTALEPSGTLGADVSFTWLTATSILLPTLGAGGWIALRTWRRRMQPRAAGTWDCGYARPTARIQYTGSSFSQMLVDLLGWVLWPRQRRPRMPSKPFPQPTAYQSEHPDAVLDRGLVPAFGLAERASAWARPFQRVPIQVYLLYVLAALLMLLLIG
jgi:hydrogenase-4 component B